MREPAADELGDFERTHPDAAHFVNVDDFGQRLFLLRRPGRGRRSPGAGQFRMAVAAQFFNRLREWKMPKGITIVATPLPANAVFKDGRARARRGNS